MTTAPYVNFYPSDWLAGVAGLTPAETGVYINILALIYENNGPIAYNPRRLARRMGIGAGPLKKLVDALIEEKKLTLEMGQLSNFRAEIEIQKRVSNIEKNSKNASARWEKTKQNQQKPDATASNLHMHPEPEPEPEVKKETPDGVSQKKISGRKIGNRLPDDWNLPKDWGQWALDEGWSEDAVRLESDKFKDYWTAKTGQSATKTNWLATWRNWMRNSKTPKVNKGQNHERPRTARQQASDRRLDAFLRGASET